MSDSPAPFSDPKPSVERISLLARRVLEADILLPKFQRDFVWTRKQVIDLLDSIAKNYPIGSMLLWQSSTALENERAIAGLKIRERKAGYPVNYLLDGQQRLSTICGALYWTPDSRDVGSIWNISYDLKTGKFVHLHTLDSPVIHQMPVRLIPDPAAYFRRAAALDSDELRKRADHIFNRFQDYMVAAVTLGDISINEVAPIFERINSTGTPLTVVDLMRAATWKPNFDLRDSIDTILSVLSEKHFGKIDRKTVLRSMAAAAGFGFSIDSIDRLRELSTEQLESAVANVEQAARRAVDFLAQQIKAPTADALPYLNQFAVLIEIFRLVPAPNAVQYAAIHRWFWRTALSGYFGGWNTGQMTSDRAAVKEFVEGRTQDIEIAQSIPRSDVWRTKQFRSNNALSKMLALMLSYHSPRDLVTGQSIDVGKALSWSNDKEYHHFFPRAYLSDQGVSAGKSNIIANIIMLTSYSNIQISKKAPSDYLGQLCKQEGVDEVKARLTSCLISARAFDAAMEDDYDGFLRERAVTLQEEAMKLVGTAAADNASDPELNMDDISSAIDEALAAPAETDPVVFDADEPVDRDSSD